MAASIARLRQPSAIEAGLQSPLDLSAGELRATLAPASGGRIAAFWRQTARARDDVIAAMDGGSFDAANWPKAGSYPLVPWSNRIRNGRFSFEGREIVAPAHPACAPHALHGFGHCREWTARRISDSSARMDYAHDPAHGPDGFWPWAFDTTQLVTLDATGLTIEMSVRNQSDEAMPIGFGVHPFFAAAEGEVASFSAGAVWPADESGCATSPNALTGEEKTQEVAAGCGRTLHYSDWSGVAAIRRKSGLMIVMQASPAWTSLVAHAPAGGRYICLEPVSHVVDAFNIASGEAGAQSLDPGATCAGTLRISVFQRVAE